MKRTNGVEFFSSLDRSGFQSWWTQLVSYELVFNVRRGSHFKASIIWHALWENYAMFGFITLTLASPIPKHSSQICVHSLHQPLIVEKSDEIVSGRDLIAAPLFAAFKHRQNLRVSISSPNDCSWPCLICFPNIGFHRQSRRQKSGP